MANKVDDELMMIVVITLLFSSMVVTCTYISICHTVLEIVNISCYKQIQIPNSLFEMHQQGIMVVVFNE